MTLLLGTDAAASLGEFGVAGSSHGVGRRIVSQVRPKHSAKLFNIFDKVRQPHTSQLAPNCLRDDVSNLICSFQSIGSIELPYPKVLAPSTSRYIPR